MGRKALLAAVCWLTLSQTFGVRITFSSAIPDNESAESAPRLYRSAPVGVYAGGAPYAPYAAYSFHLPTFLAAPQSAASQTVSVKENYVNHLTDSYGNKFVGTPQLSSYKLAFPQQFVPLQTKLPEHLAQPLVAASANFQFKQANGQFFGAPYRVPALQGPVPTPLNQFPTFGQLYGDKVKNLAPNSVHHHQTWGLPKTQHQQSTNNKAVFTNTQSQEQFNEPKQKQQKQPQLIIGKPKIQSSQEVSHVENKLQRVPETPYTTYSESKFQKIQEAPNAHSSEVKSTKHQQHLESPYLHSTQSSHESPSDYSEPKFQRIQELPHYESKFQIIDEGPGYQKIQEHRAPPGEIKFQRLQEAPSTAQPHLNFEERPQQANSAEKSNTHKAKLQTDPSKQVITYINDINGKKTIVELETKPNLPLLDLTLLEPLTFDKPLVPQVQHFLPRINQATYQKLPDIVPTVKNYQKEFTVPKATSYNSAESYEKPQAPKKKQKKPTQPNKYYKHNEAPKKTTVTHHETLDDAPEITYQIAHSPNYIETVKQKAVSYNKETQSEPVQVSYVSNTDKKPVTYSYSRTTKQPLQLKSEYGNGPTHLIYTFKPEEQVHEERSHNSGSHHSGEAQQESETPHESHDGAPYHEHHHTEQYKGRPESAEEHHEQSQAAKENYQKQKEEKQQHQKVETLNDNPNPPKYYSEPVHITSENINFQPILREYENNIRLLTAPSASIKLDPHQHQPAKPTSPTHTNHHGEQSHQQRQHSQNSPGSQEHHHSSSEQQRHHSQEHSSPASQERPQTSSESHGHRHQHPSSAKQEQVHSTPAPHTQYHHSSPKSETYNAPAAHVHEKSKRVIIQEETPDERHMLREQMQAEVIKREENSEEDFEKAYHDAALGFPAYNIKAADPEKDIFDPESYGVPHSDYTFDHTPFQQYQEEGDEFPKESRSRYKNAVDKMKQDYYSDFAISKPESLLDRYQNKIGYYKLFKQQKPDYIVGEEEDDKKQKSAKFSVAPSFNYHSSKEKDGNSFYGQPKPKQQLYEYDYSKGAPQRDSSAFASRPYQNYKSRISFVEPQFQYGFEPLTIPKLLDSELAAMASNDSPESERPGMRKKVYKENWYIKKTSTSSGPQAS